MTMESQSDFAKRLGKHKSYVTRLWQAGRLVKVGRLVDVEASLRKIEETADPTKAYVAERLAVERAAPTLSQPVEIDVAGGTFQEAKATKAKYDALTAKAEYERMMGKMIDREQVEQALADVVSFARQGVENMPHRVAAQLVGKDFEQIMAILRAAVVEMMTEMHREAMKRHAELTKTGA